MKSDIDCECQCGCAQRSSRWLTPARERQLVYSALMAVIAASLVAIVSIAMGLPRVWPGVLVGGAVNLLLGLRQFRPRGVE